MKWARLSGRIVLLPVQCLLVLHLKSCPCLSQVLDAPASATQTVDTDAAPQTPDTGSKRDQEVIVSRDKINFAAQG